MLQNISQPVKISIDFAKPIRKFPILGVLMLIASTCFFIYAVWQSYEANQKLSSLNQELNLIADKKLKPEVVTDPDLERMTNQIKDQLATAWPELFNVIEHHYTSAITFSSITFEARARELRINGNSNNIHTVLEFVEHLKKEHILERVDLINHHLSKLDGQSVHSFEVYAKWQ